MKLLKGEGQYWPFLHLAAVILIAASSILFSCADKSLFPWSQGNDSILVNNRLKIRGTLCNEEPGTTILPVKVLFILDNSASMGPMLSDGVLYPGNDPDTTSEGGSQRQRAVTNVVDQYGTNPAYWFAQIMFSNLIEKCPNVGGSSESLQDLEFANIFSDPSTDDYRLNCISEIRNPHNNTRMYDALMQAYIEILEDLRNMPARLQRLSTYKIILLTDGVPDDGIADCVGGIPNPNYEQPSEEEIPANVAALAADLMTLMDPDEEIRAKEVTIDTILLNRPEIPFTKVGACPGVDYEALARNLLGTIANIGNGTFFETGIPEELDFLQFVRTSIASILNFKSFMAVNLNARLSGSGELLADSDGDGLTDRYESSIGLNPRSKDTDGDGLSDKVELLLGKNPLVADSNCDTVNFSDLVDTDFDGLNDCEERYLGTNDQLPDSDGDGILDFLEVIYDTDPLVHDATQDNNQNGLSNYYEIAVHSEPNFAVPMEALDRYAYRYNMKYTGLNEELVDCYDFEIQNISLVKPLSRPGVIDGLNEILVYYIESLADDPDEYGQAIIGRYQTIYLGTGYKYPQLGVIEIDDFSEFNFVGKFFNFKF